MSGPTCAWCEKPIGATRQGLNKRFCSNRCRQHFHDGCRLVGKAMFDRGEVSIADLRQHLPPNAGL